MPRAGLSGLRRVAEERSTATDAAVQRAGEIAEGRREVKELRIGTELVWVKFPDGDVWHRLHPEVIGQTICGRDVNLWEATLGMEGEQIPEDPQCQRCSVEGD